MKKKIIIILIIGLFLTTSLSSVNALYENGKVRMGNLTSRMDVVLGPYIFFWMDLDLSTKEFCDLYYNRSDDSLHIYVEFLAEDVNDESIIKWGWLRFPRSNPSILDHKDSNFHNYFWISMKKPKGTTVEFENNRILLDTSSSVGKILWTRSTEPIHNPSIPRIPAIIGPFQGKPGIYHEYAFYSRSYNDYNLFYYIDWGDGTNSGWIGPYESCDGIKLTHKWDLENNYKIKVKAKDTLGHESSWNYFAVHISANAGYYSRQQSSQQYQSQGGSQQYEGQGTPLNNPDSQPINN